MNGGTSLAWSGLVWPSSGVILCRHEEAHPASGGALQVSAIDACAREESGRFKCSKIQEPMDDMQF